MLIAAHLDDRMAIPDDDVVRLRRSRWFSTARGRSHCADERGRVDNRI